MNYRKNILKTTGLFIFFLIINVVTASAQCDLLCNGDLENGPPNTSWGMVDASQMPCWNTTAGDNMIEVWNTGYNGVPAYSGSYFVELNANMVSTLYQNFVSASGTTVNISFAHRGRAGTDVMSVEIGRVSGPYTSLGTYSDGTTWGYYTVPYVIPSGVGNNFSLRFTSVSTSASLPTEGNFLDAISIGIPTGTLTASSTQASCFGKSDGTAQAIVNGGLPPYIYSWLPSSASTSSVTGLAAGIYTVNVTEANGCALSRTVQVTQPPSMTTTITTQPASCLGSNDGSAGISVSGSTAPYTYLWTSSGQTTAIANSLSAGTYSAIVTSATGCTVLATATVTAVNNTTLSVNSPTICSGQTATLSVSGASNYTWSPSSGLSATSGSLVTVSPSVSTTFSVTGVSLTCSVNATATVTVVNNPTLSVNSPTICSGQTATLSVSGASSYTWSPSSGLSATSGSLVTVSPSVSTTFSVTGTALACSSDATATVTVLNTPTLSVNSSTICSGQTATLSVSGAGSYTWSPSSGLSATSGSLVTVSPSVSTTFSVTGTSLACSSDATATVTVLNTPTLSVNSSTICSGQTATLSVSGAGSYTWSPSPGLSATSGSLVTVSPSVSTTFSVTGITLTCSSDATATVTVVNTPTLSVNSPTICSGQTATLTVRGADSYTWLPITGLSAGNGSVVVASPSLTTTYTVTGTLSGCTQDRISSVVVNPLPIVTVSSNSGSFIYTAEQDLVLSASGGSDYVWSDGTSGPLLVINSYNKEEYCLTVTNANACSTNTCMLVELRLESTLYVPNAFTPNNDGLNDVFLALGSNIEEYHLLIFDRWGELLFESTDQENGWPGTYKGQRVPNDIYIYKIIARGKDRVNYNLKGHITLLR